MRVIFIKEEGVMLAIDKDTKTQVKLTDIDLLVAERLMKRATNAIKTVIIKKRIRNARDKYEALQQEKLKLGDWGSKNT